MATDLSSVIQDGIAQTLELLLAKNATLEETTKAHEEDLKGECAKIEANFEFEKFPTALNFFMPALSATYILNIMMGDEEAEPIETIDDDTLDASKEVIANICGGLSTTINALESKDLGNTQFSLSDGEVVQGEDFATIENLFRFVVTVNEHKIILFLAFDKKLEPFIEKLLECEITKVESEEEKEEETQEEKSQKEETQEEEAVENIVDGKKEETKRVETDKKRKASSISLDEDITAEELKRRKLKKIIIIVGGVFGTVILAGVVLYFMGFFEPKVVKKVHLSKDELDKRKRNITINTSPKKKNITFNMSQINEKRLDKKLTLLTKYEILEDEETERNKLKEKIKKQKQEQLEQFAKQNKEEMIFQDKNSTQKITKDINETKAVNYFVQIPTLKIREFNKFIKASKEISAHLSICKDTNKRTQVFIGSFINKRSRAILIDTLNNKLQKEIKELDLTSEEFEQMCSF